MRKSLTLSALVLLSCFGTAWSAPAPTPAPAASVAPAAPAAPLDFDQLTAAPGHVSRTACTLTCPYDPTITCTSQSGNCHVSFLPKGGGTLLTCDGHSQVCQF
jgi:hypothetical protein